MPYFRAFQPFWPGCHVYESNHLRDELLLLLYIDFSLFANSKIPLCLTKWSALSCPLGGGCYIHLTKETYICCIQASLYTAYSFYHIIRQKTIGKSQTNPGILRCPASRYFP